LFFYDILTQYLKKELAMVVVALIISLILTYLIMKLSVSFGEDVFLPNKVKFTNFKISNKTLTIYPENGFDDIYKVDFNSKLKIKETDSLNISYNMNLGKIVKIREIFINDNLLFDEAYLEKESNTYMALK
jgi:hypothetical protein